MIVFFRPLAIKLGLTDAPGGRKQHQGFVPLIGGICISIGFLVASMTLPYSLGQFRSLFVASLLLILTGILDDFHELTPRARLFSQFIACLLISLFGPATLYTLGDLLFLGDIPLGWLALPITWFGAMSLINSVNMVDGIDGLAGGLCFLSFGAMAILCFLSGNHLNAYLLTIISICLFAFLLFNFRLFANKPALVFLGDAGSLFLGLLLAWFSITLSQPPFAIAHPVTMLWLIALPLMDLLTVFTLRLLNRRSPMKAGNEHLHYLLESKGLSRLSIVIILWSLALIGIVIGLLGEVLPINQSKMFLGFLLTFAAYFSASYLLSSPPSHTSLRKSLTL